MKKIILLFILLLSACSTQESIVEDTPTPLPSSTPEETETVPDQLEVPPETLLGYWYIEGDNDFLHIYQDEGQFRIDYLNSNHLAWLSFYHFDATYLEGGDISISASSYSSHVYNFDFILKFSVQGNQDESTPIFHYGGKTFEEMLYIRENLEPMGNSKTLFLEKYIGFWYSPISYDYFEIHQVDDFYYSYSNYYLIQDDETSRILDISVTDSSITLTLVSSYDTSISYETYLSTQSTLLTDSNTYYYGGKTYDQFKETRSNSHIVLDDSLGKLVLELVGFWKTEPSEDSTQILQHRFYYDAFGQLFILSESSDSPHSTLGIIESISQIEEGKYDVSIFYPVSLSQEEHTFETTFTLENSSQLTIRPSLFSSMDTEYSDGLSYTKYSN